MNFKKKWKLLPDTSEIIIMYYPFDFFYSGYLVTKAGSATVALGRFLAPHIKNQSTKALSHIIEQSDEKSQKQLNIASELTTGTVTALSTVSK